MEVIRYLKKKKEENMDLYNFGKNHIKNEIHVIYNYNLYESYNFVFICAFLLCRKIYLYDSKFKIKYLLKQIRSIKEISINDIKFNKSIHVIGIDYLDKNNVLIKETFLESTNQEIVTSDNKNVVSKSTINNTNELREFNKKENNVLNLIHYPKLSRKYYNENLPIKFSLVGIKYISSDGRKFLNELLLNKNSLYNFHLTFHNFSGNFADENILSSDLNCWLFVEKKVLDY